ncbi:hypothetical protein [Candidimonas nitroreducens]|uniref:hypothetical protein n=1 Tax=Candidimonas nitroreducens TaxID=683354 RepID=UPI001177A3FA|nr:hypothetical protein [Candidimonas nitroreducens]
MAYEQGTTTTTTSGTATGQSMGSSTQGGFGVAQHNIQTSSTSTTRTRFAQRAAPPNNWIAAPLVLLVLLGGIYGILLIPGTLPPQNWLLLLMSLPAYWLYRLIRSPKYREARALGKAVDMRGLRQYFRPRRRSMSSGRNYRQERRAKMLQISTLAAAAVGLAFGTATQAAPPHYPQTAAVGGQPTAAETAVVRGVLGRSFGKEWTDYEKTGQHIRFTVGHADLNGDGRPDLLVSLNDSGFGYCGSGGCAGYAILATPQGYAPKAIELAYFFEKAIVLPTVHNGMHDLRYDNASKTFRWNGKGYS